MQKCQRRNNEPKWKMWLKQNKTKLIYTSIRTYNPMFKKKKKVWLDINELKV